MSGARCSLFCSGASIGLVPAPRPCFEQVALFNRLRSSRCRSFVGSAGDLDRSIPPAKAYAGAWHLVLAVTDSHRLAPLEYDFDRLKTLMLREGLTTLQLVWRERPDVFHARNPFPVGGVVEDPATGAAAAALGGYLRAAHLVPVSTTILIRQGEALGRPSRLTVEIPVSGGIIVTGTAVPIEQE